jgi:hypothetical protein
VKRFHPGVDVERVGSRRTVIQDLEYKEKEFHLEIIQVKKNREQRQSQVGFSD